MEAAGFSEMEANIFKVHGITLKTTVFMVIITITSYLTAIYLIPTVSTPLLEEHYGKQNSKCVYATHSASQGITDSTTHNKMSNKISIKSITQIAYDIRLKQTECHKYNSKVPGWRRQHQDTGYTYTNKYLMCL